jgi:hypothetical protein
MRLSWNGTGQIVVILLASFALCHSSLPTAEFLPKEPSPEEYSNDVDEELSRNMTETDGSRSSEEERLMEEEDLGDSDVSEERNSEDFINTDLAPVKLEGDHGRPDDSVSIILNAFNNRKSFSCPKIKDDFVTGTSTGDLSPEDIGIIAAMGDSLATGAGLWPRTDIEFRGAAFPIGGDATIDGLVTVPNILREFMSNSNLYGVSHGMGSREQLPEHQLNVAVSGATSSSLPSQANELVARINRLKEVNVRKTWAMIIITIGTEEVCRNCTAPDTDALRDALDILNRGIHKAFVVLLGPIHVSSSYHQKANLLKSRCECSRDMSNEFMIKLSQQWSSAFDEVQEHVLQVKRKTFNVLALPMLTITSRYPYSLFIPNRPLLNRRGHNYAAKWLWNRLIAGPKYNLSKAILSQDAYFCPSVGCPYFRTPDNYNYCKILRYVDIDESEGDAGLTASQKRRRTQYDLYMTAVYIVLIAFCTVITLGTVFYQKSKKSKKGRFDDIPVGEPYLSRSSVRNSESAADEGTPIKARLLDA